MKLIYSYISKKEKKGSFLSNWEVITGFKAVLLPNKTKIITEALSSTPLIIKSKKKLPEYEYEIKVVLITKQDIGGGNAVYYYYVIAEHSGKQKEPEFKVPSNKYDVKDLAGNPEGVLVAFKIQQPWNIFSRHEPKDILIGFEGGELYDGAQLVGTPSQDSSQSQPNQPEQGKQSEQSQQQSKQVNYTFIVLAVILLAVVIYLALKWKK
ncbi:MAG: hypothetical protein ABIL45_04290 [candidate division WOR-3 bacterium]